jgi:hypothetical protein
MAAAPALVPPSFQIGQAEGTVETTVLSLADFLIVIAREAVRAGPSQAPPGRA